MSGIVHLFKNQQGVSNSQFFGAAFGQEAHIAALGQVAHSGTQLSDSPHCKGSKGVPCQHLGDGFNADPASLAHDNI